MARELNILFSLPMQAGLTGRAAAVKAAEALYARNDALPRLKKLLEVLGSLKDEGIPFIKN